MPLRARHPSLFFVAFMSLLVVLALAALARAQSIHTSAFLDHEQLAALTARDELVCHINTLAGGSNRTERVVFPMHEVLDTLSRHSRDHRKLSVSGLRGAIKAMDIMFERMFPPGLEAASQSLFASMMTTLNSEYDNLPCVDENMLCVELFALQGRFNVFLPYFTCSELAYTRHHSVDYLESRFGMPMIIPPTDAINLFSNKSAFARWMSSHDLGSFVPRVYATAEDAQYPCFVKYVAGHAGLNITIANDADELARATESSPLSDYVIQEGSKQSIHPITHVADIQLFRENTSLLFSSLRGTGCCWASCALWTRRWRSW